MCFASFLAFSFALPDIASSKLYCYLYIHFTKNLFLSGSFLGERGATRHQTQNKSPLPSAPKLLLFTLDAFVRAHIKKSPLLARVLLLLFCHKKKLLAKKNKRISLVVPALLGGEDHVHAGLC